MSKVKTVSCADAGYDCSFVARAETEEDLLTQVAKHVKAEHNITEITDELVASVKSIIKEEEVV